MGFTQQPYMELHNSDSFFSKTFSFNLPFFSFYVIAFSYPLLLQYIRLTVKSAFATPLKKKKTDFEYILSENCYCFFFFLFFFQSLMSFKCRDGKGGVNNIFWLPKVQVMWGFRKNESIKNIRFPIVRKLFFFNKKKYFP